MDWTANGKRFVIPVLVVLLIGTAGTAVYFYQQASLKVDSAVLSSQEVAATLAAVNKLIVLPEGETPTVATVSDPAKLQGQTFFANAKIGDKVLIYTNAKMAYLYDPVGNKLINVAPLNIGTTSAVAPK